MTCGIKKFPKMRQTGCIYGASPTRHRAIN
jgi:hypothetical protein